MMTSFSITSSKNDDDLLTTVSENICRDLKDKYLSSLPETWNIECGNRKLNFDDIKTALVDSGLSENKASKYYGLASGIETDSHIIYLTIKKGYRIIKKPLFMGEMKKQGTNDRRLAEGKSKQAIGNAAGDRVAKNFLISSDYCYICDREFFPYNVYLHGCDFNDDMTNTMKAKLTPLFGTLNRTNPWFDKDMLIYTAGHKGGSCFYQNNDFTYKQLYDLCYECCRIGIEHYLEKYR